jgi:hypothetical protein
MGISNEPRKAVEVPVRVFGTDCDGKPFSENLTTVDSQLRRSEGWTKPSCIYKGRWSACSPASGTAFDCRVLLQNTRTTCGVLSKPLLHPNAQRWPWPKVPQYK